MKYGFNKIWNLVNYKGSNLTTKVIGTAVLEMNFGLQV